MDEFDMDDFWDDDDIDDYENDNEETNMEDITVPSEDAVAKGTTILTNFINSAPSRIAWAMLAKTGDTYKVYQRVGQPCYGEMRRYGQKSTRPQDYRPGDLFSPFPDDTVPVLVGVPFIFKETHKHSAYSYRGDEMSKNIEGLFDLVFDETESPWRGILKGAQRIRGADGNSTGCILTAHVDPTAMVHFFLMIKNVLPNITGEYTTIIERKPDADRASALATAIKLKVNMRFTKSGKPEVSNNSSLHSYTISPSMHIEKFKAGAFNTKLSKDRLWDEGEDYNRPEIHKLFGEGFTGKTKEANIKIDELLKQPDILTDPERALLSVYDIYNEV